MESSYVEALMRERKSHKPVNLGLLRRHIPPPACTLMDIFEGEYHPLFPPSGPRSPTAVLFWSKWNISSKRNLGWFVWFARQNSSKVDFYSLHNNIGLISHVWFDIDQQYFRPDSSTNNQTIPDFANVLLHRVLKHCKFWFIDCFHFRTCTCIFHQGIKHFKTECFLL